MIYLKWFLLAIVSFVVTKIINFFLTPIVVLFASEDGWLPKWLNWFQTPDNTLYGDRGWITEHWQWRYKLPPALALYVGRVGWLWRNSMYGFEIDVLGVNTGDNPNLKIWGNNEVSDRPYTPGWVFRKLDNCFQFYAILPMPFNKCFRIMAGWKIWQHPKPNTNIQLALGFNPFKSRG